MKIRLAEAPSNRRRGMESGPRGAWTETKRGLMHIRVEDGSKQTLCGREITGSWGRFSRPNPDEHAEYVNCPRCRKAAGI